MTALCFDGTLNVATAPHSQPMRILFVENHNAFARTVTEAFLGEHQVEIVPDIASAKRKFASGDFQCVLVDYDLDDGKGSEVVSWIKSSSESTPVVATSSHELGNAELVSAGADAICPKHQFHKISEVFEQLRYPSVRN